MQRKLNPLSNAEETWQLLLGVGQAARMMPSRPQVAPNSIQFTLVTGFLGSGKTTLLNHLLGGTHGRRIAVVVNDFGAINIDASLILEKGDGIISLTNGCACCSIAGELTTTLLRLTEQSEPPEFVVLEASGIADPQSILHVALTNPALTLSSVLSLVDTDTVMKRAMHSIYGQVVERQISCADLVVMNKLDLVSSEECERVRTWISEIAKHSKVIQTVNAIVPADLVLDVQGLSQGGFNILQRLSHGTRVEHLFRSWSFTSDIAFSAEKLRNLAHRLPDDIIRAKGTMFVADIVEYQHVYQLVGRRWRLQRGPAWGDSPRQSQMVFIWSGDDIDLVSLEAIVESCRAQ